MHKDINVLEGKLVACYPPWLTVLCWRGKAQTHLRNTGVNFLFYSTCIAGSITYWMLTEEQTKVSQCWMTHRVTPFRLLGMCFGSGEDVSLLEVSVVALYRNTPTPSSLVHQPLLTHWKGPALPQVHAREANSYVFTCNWGYWRGPWLTSLMWSALSGGWAFPLHSQEAWRCPAACNWEPRNNKSQMKTRDLHQHRHWILNTAVHQRYPYLCTLHKTVALWYLGASHSFRGLKYWAQSRNVCLSTVQRQLEL